MRTSSLQRKKFALGNSEVEDIHDDANIRLLGFDQSDSNIVQPKWSGRLEGLKFQISRVEGKVIELETLHKKHLNRPTLEDSNNEQLVISRLTSEITQQFSQCQKQLQVFQSSCSNLKGSEKALVRNVVFILVERLQQSTEKFRSSQGSYLRNVEAREKRSDAYFVKAPELESEDDGLLLGTESWQTHERILLNQNKTDIKHRDEQIQSIVQSIADLNTIFKDLSSMISEQGELVDRIDYNIENTSIKVEKGLDQLKKANRYQKNNRKMKCILILAISFVFLLLMLVFLKS